MSTQYNPEYYQKKKEIYKTANYKWVENNRERVNASHREWRRKNKLRCQAYSRKYRAKARKITAVNSETIQINKSTLKNGIILKAGIYRLEKE